MISDLKTGAVFPSAHRLHPNAPGLFLPAASAGLIGDADLIISLDWIDLAGTISAAAAHGHPASARIISCTTDSALHNGWSKDSFGYQPVDLSVPADPDLLVRALLETGGPAKPSEWPARDGAAPPRRPRPTAATTSSCTTWPRRCATRSPTRTRTRRPAWSGCRWAGPGPTWR